MDGTFISTKEYYQLLVLLFYDENTNKKIPGAYKLCNNKFENSYIKILYKLKYIITVENIESLKLESICADFEMGLIRTITKVFKNIWVVGCLFHYIKNIRSQALKLGLFYIFYYSKCY